MLSVRDVHTYYDESHVLHGMSFDLRDGEVATLIGRNGVGKTTTLRSIMGIVRPRSGSIVLDGNELCATPSDRIARSGIAYVPEERGIFSTLNVRENLLFAPALAPGGWTLDRIFDAFPNLKERASAVGTTLSGGEQQMLAIARALRSGAKTILLDEPTEGLAPVIVERIGEIVRRMKAAGISVLLVEQNVRFAAAVADRHHIVVHGRVEQVLDTADLVARESDLLEFLGV
ncbi:MAG TPA: ABC transporter ATP-binding protein [Candidatus Baltobacteraceae bacterium]|nr:ABC transporter ATP-binding protein [Candidatus Baltobacteraceae bacterium]